MTKFGAEVFSLDRKDMKSHKCDGVGSIFASKTSRVTEINLRKIKYS